MEQLDGTAKSAATAAATGVIEKKATKPDQNQIENGTEQTEFGREKEREREKGHGMKMIRIANWNYN